MTRRTAFVVVCSLLSGIVWTFAPALAAPSAAPSAAPAPAMEDDFVARIASERAAAGVPGYVVASDLADVARRHAEDMARQDRLHHNPRLTEEVQDWEAVGENVGTGGSVEDIHRAFMASSTHRSEILSTRFTEVGVGVALREDGAIWVAQVFRRPRAAPPPPPPPPSSSTTSTTPTSGARPAPDAGTAAAGRPTTTVPVPGAPAASASAPDTATDTGSSTVPVTPASEAVGRASELAGRLPATPPSTREPGGSVRAGPAGTPRSSSGREVSAPTSAAAASLLLVVGALAAEVAADQRRGRRRPEAVEG